MFGTDPILSQNLSFLHLVSEITTPQRGQNLQDYVNDTVFIVEIQLISKHLDFAKEAWSKIF